MSFGIESFGVGSFGAPAEQAGGSVTLVIQDSSQAQTIDNIGLSANGATDLVVQDVAQAQTIDAIALSIMPVVDVRGVPMGDSNGSGRGSFNQTNSAAEAYLFDNSGVVVALTDPYDGPPNTYAALDDGTSAAGSYVHHLADLLDAAGKSVMFIPANKGGSKASDWTSTAAGSNYAALKARVNAAGGDGPDLVFFIHLGANDAIAGVSQATFTSNMNTVIANLAADFPSAKLAMQKIHHNSSATTTNIDNIRAAVDDLWANNSDVSRGADLEGITTNVHYGQTGNTTTCTSELNEVALRTYGAVFGESLVVADSAQAQTVDSLVLSQESTLAIADSAQAQLSDIVVLSLPGTGASAEEIATAVWAKLLGVRSASAHVQAMAATLVGSESGAGTSHITFTDGAVTVEADVPLPGAVGDRTNVVISGV
jgi:hypothetical protein